MEKKYLNFNFTLKTLDENNSETFVFEGYASTFGNIDRGNDVILRGAFRESIKELTPQLLWQHKSTEPLGIFTEVYEDETGLYVKGIMPKSDEFVRNRVVPQMKIGSINKMSIGFSIVEDEYNREDKVRIIKKVKLWEISLVSIPMNDRTNVLSIKSAVPYQDLPFPKKEDGEIDFEYAWDSVNAIKRVREFTKSDEMPSSEYKKSFLYYDKESVDNFTAYKLPIADVINDRLMVIPRAIYAAAAAMRGARGGVDIPENERNAIINNINRYYDKMEKDSPFKKNFSSFIDEIDKIKELSEFLKEWGFSNGETNSLVSALKRISRNEGEIRNESKKMLDEICKIKNITKELSHG